MESWRTRRLLAKHKITASEALDRITDFLSTTDGRTNEELREDLEAKGIDVDKHLAETEKILNKYGLSMHRKKGVKTDE